MLTPDAQSMAGAMERLRSAAAWHDNRSQELRRNGAFAKAADDHVADAEAIRLLLAENAEHAAEVMRLVALVEELEAERDGARGQAKRRPDMVGRIRRHADSLDPERFAETELLHAAADQVATLEAELVALQEQSARLDAVQRQDSRQRELAEAERQRADRLEAELQSLRREREGEAETARDAAHWRETAERERERATAYEAEVRSAQALRQANETLLREAAEQRGLADHARERLAALQTELREVRAQLAAREAVSDESERWLEAAERDRQRISALKDELDSTKDALEARDAVARDASRWREAVGRERDRAVALEAEIAVAQSTCQAATERAGKLRRALAELQAQLEAEPPPPPSPPVMAAGARNLDAASAERVNTLETALRPFAEAAALVDDSVPADLRAGDEEPIENALFAVEQPRVGDLRAAARALSPPTASAADA